MLMMLAPIGAWAVDYGLTVAGVQVTDVNASNVLGDEIKTVSYDNTNHILTLRGANISYTDTSAIVVGEDISALTIHLVGNSTISTGDFSVISFANANSSLTVTTSKVLPGSLDAAKFAWNITPVYQNGLTYSNGTIGASLDNTEISLFTGRETYANTDNGDNSYIYSSFEFYASYATNVDGNHFVKVSTKESATTAAMWPSSLNNPGLVEKVTLQFGACTNNDVTVQVKGLDNEGNADGKTYSEAIALSTANTDGIIEIPVENVTSDNLQLQFSSESSFSFFPITIAFTRSPVKIGGGIGTSDDPFLIKTAEDLKTLSEYINNGIVGNGVSVKLNNNIDCESLEDFMPIGTSDYFFDGTFDGDNMTITKLEFVASDYASYAGLFGKVGENALVKDLTLDHCTISGGIENGAVVGYMSSGTVQNCTVTNSNVSTSGDVSSPYCGGIVGYAQGGTVSNCVVNGCTITATTTTDDGVPYTGGIIGDTNGDVTISGCEVSGTEQNPTIISSTHNESYAGGIVANCEGTAAEGSATITGCSVKGKVTVSAEDQSYESAFAGAIAGSPYEATLTSNTYEYSVKTSTKTFDETNETTVTTEKEGYEQRGIGGLEIIDITGAVMYTQTVTLPGETDGATVIGKEGTYYSWNEEETGILVAPSQTATIQVSPEHGYTIASLTATNETTEATITTESVELGDNITQYTFAMPDAPVTITLSMTYTPDAPTMSGTALVDADGIALTLTSEETTGTIKYSIDYDDANETDVTDNTYDADNKPTINKPATVTAYLSVNGNNSATVTGKYFGFVNGNELDVTYGTTQVEMPTLVPAIAEADNVTISKEGTFVDDGRTIINLEGITTIGKAQTTIITSLSSTGDTPYTLLNNYVNLDVNILPPAPTIAFDEEKTYLDTDYTEITLPESLATFDANIYYSWNPDCAIDNGNDYGQTGVPMTAGIGTHTLYAWVKVNDVYSAKTSQEFTIKSDIDKWAVKDLTTSVTYTGLAITPTFTLWDGQIETNILSESDYDVVYETMVNQELEVVSSIVDAGTYVITVQGKGNYGGEKIITREFTVSPANLSDVTIEPIADQSYIGSVIEPEVTVKLGDVTIDAEQYSVEYSNNTNVGEATVTVTFTSGNFTTSGAALVKTATFNIVNRTLADNEVEFHNNWATFYSADGDVELPTDKNIGAFVATGIGDGVVSVSQISYIPEDVPVFLNNATENVSTVVFDKDKDTNLLEHTDKTINANTVDALYYGLHNGKMMRVSGTIPAGRNYIKILTAVNNQPQAPELSFVFEGDVTGVNEVRSKMEDVRDDIYDLQGRKVQKPSKKGLYIQNGKKVVVNNK